MFAFLLFLLLVWIVVAVLGFAIHGLIWLAIIGIVLFVLCGIGAGVARR
jgi:hypothetical protein